MRSADETLRSLQGGVVCDRQVDDVVGYDVWLHGDDVVLLLLLNLSDKTAQQ